MFQKLYRHLEEANATLRRQETAINANASCSQDIVRKLEAMNEHARSSQKHLEQTSKSFTSIVPGFLVVLLLLSVGIIVYLSIGLSRLTSEMAGSRQLAQQETQVDLQKNRNILYLMNRQQEMAEQLIRLDSIISQQRQSLFQLKDLNAVSTRAFFQIKNKIDQTNRLIRLLQTDSGRVIGFAK